MYCDFFRIFRKEFEYFIIGRKRTKLIQNDSADLPQFLRFDDVELNYCCQKVPIKEMCRLVVNYLQPLKKALNDTHLITFIAGINENDPSKFSNHLQLLNHVQEELLPICDSSYGYKFEIRFNSDKIAGANVIRQILQMPPIDRCSNVEISLHGLAYFYYEHVLGRNKLPIEAISSFLHQDT